MHAIRHARLLQQKIFLADFRMEILMVARHIHDRLPGKLLCRPRHPLYAVANIPGQHHHIRLCRTPRHGGKLQMQITH